jgi:uncharacterized protein (DUF1697 family)
MTRYAAFIRAINLAKRRRVTSEDLRAAFEDLGFEDVATFRTSGNVVFSGDREALAALTARVDKALTKALEFEVVTFLRTAREVRALAAEQPFAAADVEQSSGKLQVMLLHRKPPAGAQRKVLALASDADALAFGKRELFWLPSGGLMESELDRDAIGGLLGAVTVRTKGTIDALAAKYFAG